MVASQMENTMNAIAPAPQVPPTSDEARDCLIRNELLRFGLSWLGKISWNEANWRLVQKSVARDESQLSATGALVVETGQHTGRSPKDKFIVRDASTENEVWWDNNKSMTPRHFEVLKADMLAFARMKDLFVQDLEACPGADKRLPVRLVVSTAWGALFMRHLLKPAADQEGHFRPELTIVCLPGFKAAAGQCVRPTPPPEPAYSNAFQPLQSFAVQPTGLFAFSPWTEPMNAVRAGSLQSAVVEWI